VKYSKALTMREKMSLTHQGMAKGTIYPESRMQAMKVENHPFFGMNSKKD